MYLNNGNVQKNPTQANGEGGRSHDRRTDKEPHGHCICRKGVPTGDDPGLQCHEQPCIAIRKHKHNCWLQILNIVTSIQKCSRYRPRLNIAIPSPASDRIEIDRAMIAGISIPHLKLQQIS